ncbi:MAG: hypothetical protein WBY94_28630 [Polyangiaceae bacterium]
MDLPQASASVHTCGAPSSRPSTVEAIYATAHWLLFRERVEDAAKVFRVMLRVAPHDERGWLGLGECHERIDQPRIAAELYGAGSVIAGGSRAVSVRCLVARARALAKVGPGAEIEGILDAAESAAAAQDDEELLALVADERRRLS